VPGDAEIRRIVKDIIDNADSVSFDKLLTNVAAACYRAKDSQLGEFVNLLRVKDSESQLTTRIKPNGVMSRVPN